MVGTRRSRRLEGQVEEIPVAVSVGDTKKREEKGNKQNEKRASRASRRGCITARSESAEFSEIASAARSKRGGKGRIMKMKKGFETPSPSESAALDDSSCTESLSTLPDRIRTCDKVEENRVCVDKDVKFVENMVEEAESMNPQQEQKKILQNGVEDCAEVAEGEAQSTAMCKEPLCIRIRKKCRAQQKEIADLKVKANLSKEELSSLSVRMQEYQDLVEKLERQVSVLKVKHKNLAAQKDGPSASSYTTVARNPPTKESSDVLESSSADQSLNPSLPSSSSRPTPCPSITSNQITATPTLKASHLGAKQPQKNKGASTPSPFQLRTNYMSPDSLSYLAAIHSLFAPPPARKRKRENGGITKTAKKAPKRTSMYSSASTSTTATLQGSSNNSFAASVSASRTSASALASASRTSASASASSTMASASSSSTIASASSSSTIACASSSPTSSSVVAAVRSPTGAKYIAPVPFQRSKAKAAQIIDLTAYY